VDDSGAGRRRFVRFTGSLLAPALLHLATNSLGVLAAAAALRLS
jgi:hypothetical protein